MHVLDTGRRHDPKLDVKIGGKPDAMAQIIEDRSVFGVDGHNVPSEAARPAQPLSFGEIEVRPLQLCVGLQGVFDKLAPGRLPAAA
jgi:hypothetical protein